VGFFRDITERKQWEEALRDAKEKWTSLTENTDDIVMIVDGNGVIQYINRTIPPYTPEETVGRTVYDYVPREQHDVLEKSLREVFKTGKPDRYEVSSSIPTIGTIWFSTKIVPIKHDRKVSSAILISSDITERKKAEEKIRLLSNVVQQASEGIAVSDLNGRILFVNSAWLKMHRFNEDEEKDLVGKEVGRFYCRQQVESIDRKVQSAGIFRGRITQVRKDGTTFPALATLSPLKNENGQIIGIIRMAKNLTEIVRDIRDVGSSNVWSSKNGRTEGTGA
jgi:PAS domain S-box-containing protein